MHWRRVVYLEYQMSRAVVEQKLRATGFRYD